MAPIIVTPVQKRFSDVDSFCHINNVSQQMYFDLGKQEYYRRVLGDSGALVGMMRIITASTATSYLGQVRMDDELHVTTTVGSVGNKSITLFQQLICGEEVRAESTSVMVAFDFERQESFPVPDAWRKAFLG